MLDYTNYKKGIHVRNKRSAFTIIELLTALVIIVILISLLLPSITMVRRMARETAQKAQFTTMDMSLNAFKQDYGDYPPSNTWDAAQPGVPAYCGAQKLTEALVGWDLMGFHPNSAWRSDGGGLGGPYDPPNPGPVSIQARRGPYLEQATANVFRLGESAAGAIDGLYTNPALLPLSSRYVICDVFTVKKLKISTVGKTTTYKAGTPILYYKANISATTMLNTPPWSAQRYDFQDNMVLADRFPLISKPGGTKHPLREAKFFYSYQGGLVDPKISAKRWPYRPDSYILISAGMDGLYGTQDDIHNY